MSLKEYYGHTVKIIADNGEIFLGFVDDYFFSDDNEDDLESIVVTTSKGLFEFKEDDIKAIEIIWQYFPTSLTATQAAIKG